MSFLNQKFTLKDLFNGAVVHFSKGGKAKDVKFVIEENEDGDRTDISIKDIGAVVLVQVTPQYEYKDDLTEEEFEELGIDEGDFIGKIEHIKVADAYKGKGYAKLLMNKAIEVAKEKGIFPIYLNASPMGSDGLVLNDLTEFYKSFGFKVFKEMGNNNLMLLRESDVVSKLLKGGPHPDS